MGIKNIILRAFMNSEVNDFILKSQLQQIYHTIQLKLKNEVNNNNYNLTNECTFFLFQF